MSEPKEDPNPFQKFDTEEVSLENKDNEKLNRVVVSKGKYFYLTI